MQWIKKYWHKTRKFLEENFLVSVLVLLLLQVLLLMRFEKVDISWSSFSATTQFFLVIFQCVILYRQAKIMRRQAEISEKNILISKQANIISEKVSLIPIQHKILVDWLDAGDIIRKMLVDKHNGTLPFVEVADDNLHTEEIEGHLEKIDRLESLTLRLANFSRKDKAKKIKELFFVDESGCPLIYIIRVIIELPCKNFDSNNILKIIKNFDSASSEVIEMYTSKYD